jgi:hypothetical protein
MIRFFCASLRENLVDKMRHVIDAAGLVKAVGFIVFEDREVCIVRNSNCRCGFVERFRGDGKMRRIPGLNGLLGNANMDGRQEEY